MAEKSRWSTVQTGGTGAPREAGSWSVQGTPHLSLGNDLAGSF